MPFFQSSASTQAWASYKLAQAITEKFEGIAKPQAKYGSITEPTQSMDWRIGLSAKVKYRTHSRYYEGPAEIIGVLPSGTNGIADKDGVLKLKTSTGEVILEPSDNWVTA